MCSALVGGEIHIATGGQFKIMLVTALLEYLDLKSL